MLREDLKKRGGERRGTVNEVMKDFKLCLNDAGELVAKKDYDPGTKDDGTPRQVKEFIPRELVDLLEAYIISQEPCQRRFRIRNVLFNQ